ncbi:hypothetical protein GLOTRDRAFT_52143 [Gloeophyllum trabeum ATCC 11539]|uniref:Post-SET domain-containing protein n=1 Tax=Gloeophyllum trabeum (strain ATCC 11539 / FP-39264 / Madison 617) TaxID=670483 RepID=S7S313_GLOTA|nr:uncharacterized protein GLOTRDRAFT_52143 [Gloeophyllum trabeum ATCC 11539]EPQ60209.1 hypothetical protein GLOTRDRAFT_52143 [Gloeophyllum trabeum ATCC 11539]
MLRNKYRPSHPDRFRVDFRSGNFASQLLAVREFEDGEIIATLEGITEGPKRYSSVQISRDMHIELNSDLLYMNHSCDPSAIIDVSARQVRATRFIPANTPITFFYPSTEWEMAQPFSCNCGARNCLGSIKGAKWIEEDRLKDFWCNEHIWVLKREQSGNGERNKA